MADQAGIDDIDPFTGWILAWQHWILASLALLFIATIIFGR